MEVHKGNKIGMDSQSLTSSLTSTESNGSHTSRKDDGVALEKNVGLASAISLIVGVIIGSGIFISPKGVAYYSGSVGMSLVFWGLGGLVTMIASVCMAELGTMLPASGGEYIYLKLGLADWCAFIWMWTSCLLIRPAATAITTLTCAEYVLTPIFDDGCGRAPDFYIKLTAAVFTLLVAMVNVWSVRLAAAIQIIFTVAKILALIVIIVGGIVRLAQGYTENLATGFDHTNDDPGEIIMAFYSAMFAYEGWSNLNSVTEEVVNPGWTLPTAMYIGIPMVTILYIMANVSYFTVMSVPEMLASPAVAITWAETVLPGVPWLIPVVVAMSTFGGANGSLFSVGRLFYTAAKGGDMPNVMSYIHVKNVTPMPAILVSAALIIMWSLIGEVYSLLNGLSFVTWLFYALVMSAFLVMRYREQYKSMHRPYKAPLIFPILVLIFAVTLVIVPMVLNPQIEFAVSIIVFGLGFIVYFPFVLCKIKMPGMDRMTCFFQLLIEIVPPAELKSEDHIFRKNKMT